VPVQRISLLWQHSEKDSAKFFENFKALEGKGFVRAGGANAYYPRTWSANQCVQQEPGKKAAVALNFAYYNFCKVHGSLRVTPAMAAGVSQSICSVSELLDNAGER